MKKQKFKYRNANKQKGIILRSLDGSPSLFRIYGKKGSFKDYEIIHNDIQVQIQDDDAEFLESIDGETFLLDHSRQTLGHNTKNPRVKKKKVANN
jgi:hypothetical protein